MAAETGNTSPATSRSAAACSADAMPACFVRSILLTAITTGTRAARNRPAMNRSPGPTPCSALITNRQPSASCELVLDPPLHPLGQRVARPLDAR